MPSGRRPRLTSFGLPSRCLGITHEHRLRRSRAPLERFLAEANGLCRHGGPLLVQLPPSFAFEARAAASFFGMMRERYEGTVVCEPRHPTWFGARAGAMMSRYFVARVAADPAITEESNAPGGWNGLAYFRLHGAPRMYWSRYEARYLSRLATVVRRISESADVWCVFDNTASGAAMENAWELRQLLSETKSGFREDVDTWHNLETYRGLRTHTEW